MLAHSIIQLIVLQVMSRKMDIKICGVTNLEDARVARDAGADFLGFVLYRRSPRGITAKTLCRITSRLTGAVKAIGVFVNEPRDRIIQVARDSGLYAVQIHGDESAADILPLPMVTWRALCFCGKTWSPLPARWPAARYVLDATIPGAYGGTGRRVNWKAAALLSRRYPVMLAGGLTPDNVTDAIRRVCPQGVDVASGVEKMPGKKDHRKLEAFIRAVRNCQKIES